MAPRKMGVSNAVILPAPARLWPYWEILCLRASTQPALGAVKRLPFGGLILTLGVAGCVGGTKWLVWGRNITEAPWFGHS